MLETSVNSKREREREKWGAKKVSNKERSWWRKWCGNGKTFPTTFRWFDPIRYQEPPLSFFSSGVYVPKVPSLFRAIQAITSWPDKNTIFSVFCLFIHKNEYANKILKKLFKKCKFWSYFSVFSKKNAGK